MSEDQPDLKVTSDGTMTTDDTPVAINVKSKPNTSPEVNTIAPPPAPPLLAVPKVAAPSATQPVQGELKTSAPLVAAKQSQQAQPHVRQAPSENSSDGANEPSPHSRNNPVQQSNPEPTQAPQKETSAKKHRPHEHRNNKKVAVIVTIVVAIILAAGAVFVYISTQDNAERTSTQLRENSETTTDPVTGNEIADLLDETDETLDDSGSSDFDEESLSDPALGL